MIVSFVPLIVKSAGLFPVQNQNHNDLLLSYLLKIPKKRVSIASTNVIFYQDSDGLKGSSCSSRWKALMPSTINPQLL